MLYWKKVDNSRRKFIGISAGLIASSSLLKLAYAAEKMDNLDQGVFEYGVASGDPLADKVIIWTRVTAAQDLPNVRLSYEVALDKHFLQPVHSAMILASKENDYTVKIDLQQLQPNTVYFYRFQTANAISTVGKTRTLALQTDKVTLAVFSCANYTNGYFNAYHDACKFTDKIDVVIHLGDYIYEQGMRDKSGAPGYATSHAQAIGRVLPAGDENEAISLTDYRRRYASYRSDPDLQLVHSLYPFICIWDDHEVVDNAYTRGAGGYADKPHEYELRKKAAIKAYYEWLPIRVSSTGNSSNIYRVFHFGTLFSLYMLDTRLLSRTRQPDYRNHIQADGRIDLSSIESALNDPQQKLIGDEQSAWLNHELNNSQAQWQVIAQQVRLSENEIPREIVELAEQYNKSQGEQKRLLKKSLIDAFNELSRIKARMQLSDSSLTEQETDRLKFMLPYNLDAWDGYPLESKKLYQFMQGFNKPFVVLSGDAHYSWANELVDENDNTAGIELGVTSVTSPGIEEDYAIEDSALLVQLEQASALFNERSLYANYRDRGYLIVEVDRTEIKAHWRYVDTIMSRDYQSITSRNHLLRLAYKNGHYFYR